MCAGRTSGTTDSGGSSAIAAPRRCWSSSLARSTRACSGARRPGGPSPRSTPGGPRGSGGPPSAPAGARPRPTAPRVPPAGTFSPRSLEGDFLLFAAGSGITPVISILKSALAAGRGRVVLIYANRDERSVIFSTELRRLAAEAAGRLLVVHWLDSLHGEPRVAGMAALARPYAAAEAFACGPDPYLAVVRQALSQLGVKAVHVERFLSLAENPFEVTEVAGGVAAALRVSL